MILLICCSLLLFILFLIEAKRLQLSYKFKHIPGVREYPIIGSHFTLKPTGIQGVILVKQKKISKLFIKENL